MSLKPTQVYYGSGYGPIISSGSVRADFGPDGPFSMPGQSQHLQQLARMYANATPRIHQDIFKNEKQI